ncbi:cation transporter [Terrimonas sp.]|uniref:cation transporter n=1 Tax=Terrimonas sp. TaxID=1914338 RepID=UPI000D51F063|nr:cation transporter [Terrimonas sp.]PVD52977.1 cation transporter [Terrimonas sp.]
MSTSIQLEQRTLRISLCLTVLLTFWGLIFAEITESNIIELDAGSYIISGLLGIVTIYVSKLQDRPSDRIHPFGYAGFVPILNLIRSFMILLICLKAISGSLGDFVNGPEETIHAVVFLYAGITMLINGIAYIITYKAAKKSGSAILKIDAVEWLFDIYFNAGVLLAFGVSYVLRLYGYSKIANHIDPAFCIILSVIMCIPVIHMFHENIKKLSVRSVDKQTYKRIRHRFSEAFPKYQQWKPQLTAVDMSGVVWVELKFEQEIIDGMQKEDWQSIEETGKKILAEIADRYHLTFKLTNSDLEDA